MSADRKRAVGAMTRAMFECYSGYDAETKRMMFQREKRGLESRASRALQALHEAGFAVVPREGKGPECAAESIYRKWIAVADLSAPGDRDGEGL